MLVKTTVMTLLLNLFVSIFPLATFGSSGYVLPVDITTDAAVEDITPVAFTIYTHSETYEEDTPSFEVYGYLLPEGSNIYIPDELYFETVVYGLYEPTGRYYQESVWVNGPWEAGNQVTETITTDYIWEIVLDDALRSSYTIDFETRVFVGSASMDPGNYRQLTEEELAQISVGLIKSAEEPEVTPSGPEGETESTENTEVVGPEEDVDTEDKSGTADKSDGEDQKEEDSTVWIAEHPAILAAISAVAVLGGGLVSVAAVTVAPSVEVSAGIRPRRGVLHVNGDVDVPEIHYEDVDEIAIPVHVTEAEDMNWIIGAKAIVPGYKKLIETKAIPTSGSSAEIKLKWNPDAGKIKKKQITLYLEVAALGIDLHGENNLLEKMVEIPVCISVDKQDDGNDSSKDNGKKVISTLLIGALLTGMVSYGAMAPVHATDTAVITDFSTLTDEEILDMGMAAYEEENYELAYSYFAEAVARENTIGYWNLGYMYYKGLYVEQDYVRAMDNWKLAAEGGNSNAMNMIGRLYSTGSGVEQNRATAIEWYERGAAAGNETAMGNLVYTYTQYKEVRNFEKAVSWLETLAELGDVEALVDLGYMSYHGRGTEQDYQEAINYFREAADKGSTDALFNLGYMFYFGKGVDQSYEIAMEYFSQGADAGHHYSMMYIGFMYTCGYGVTQDLSVAKEWAQKLQDAGDDNGYYRIYGFIEEWESAY